MNQFVKQLKTPTRKTIENQKFLSTKLEIILRAAAKEFNNYNDDPATLIEGDEVKEKTSRKRRYSVESSDCDATQVEDLPGYSPELKKRHRLNSNSFIYVEGKDDTCSSECSENIPLEDLNFKRDLRSEEFSSIFTNPSFIENLAQNITKAKHTSCTPKRSEEKQDADDKSNPQEQMTGDILDELIKNVLGEIDNDPEFHVTIEAACGKFFIFIVSHNSFKGGFFAHLVWLDGRSCITS